MSERSSGWLGRNRFRVVLAAGLALIVVAGTIPTTSFTSATVTRDVSVSTATDDTAVVQLETYETQPTETCIFVFCFDPRARLVTISNWFESPLDITVTVTSGNALVSETRYWGYEESVELANVNQDDTVWFRVNDVSDKPVTFSIHGNVTGVSVRIPSRKRTW
jgi:hypothetical protein